MADRAITVAPPTGDAGKDTQAINAAIKAAHAAYLQSPQTGQVTVQLSAGNYIVTGDKANPSVGPVELLSGVALVGAGMGQTVLKLADHFNARINGIVRTALEDVSNVTVAGLTIDGNRANNTTGNAALDHQAGFICGVKAGSGAAQSDITLSDVEIMNCTAYGFNPHEVTYRMVIENCRSHNNGLDGFVADGVIGGVYKNNLAYENDRHGFNIQNATEHLDLVSNQAFGNGSAGAVIQRGDIFRDGAATIEWVSSIQILGGEYYGNRKEGILVKLSDNVTIDSAAIYNNLRQGVRVEGSTDTAIKNNLIFNNSQEAADSFDELQIRFRADPVTGGTYYSTNTQIFNNEIYSDSAINARYGIREEVSNLNGGLTGTQIAGNSIFGMDSGPASVPGYNYPPGGTSADGQALVNDVFYLARYADVRAVGIDADDHYAQYGWREGRDPNAFFSTNAYLSANQDVDAANINPLDHYHQYGWKEGRDASVRFDTSLYLINNPDVAAARIDPLEHYLAYGRFEGRQTYAAVGLGVQGTFDAEYYLLANPDVGLADVDAAFHFQTYGWKEGRDPNAFFDTSAYLAAYADVAAAGVNPLEHYNNFGWKEGRDPSGAFDTDAYLSAYTDVAAAGVNPLAHYLKYGAYEGRSTFGDSLIG